MHIFSRETLAVSRYQDLVKLAKEHNVYRRYAPKAELIEKLSSLKNDIVETLDDIEMPPTMDEADFEVTDIDTKGSISKASLGKGSFIPSDSPRLSRGRRSLAGPARKPSIVGTPTQQPEKGRGRVSREDTVILDASPQISRRLTRQITFDITSSKCTALEEAKSHTSLKRQGTFNLEDPTPKASSDETSAANTRARLTRQGTFNVESGENIVSTAVPRHNFSGDKDSIMSNGPRIHNRISKTPYTTRLSHNTTEANSAAKSSPRDFVSARIKSGIRASGTPSSSKIPTKQKTLSVNEENKRKLAAVAILKESEPKKTLPKPRKVPNFDVIHSKMFNNMETLAENHRRIIDRANSAHKHVPKCASVPSRQPLRKAPIVRKLISPKYGKVPSPKPIRKPVAVIGPSLESSNKTHPVGNVLRKITNVSSPRFSSGTMFQASVKPKTQSPSISTNRFGFSAALPNRREVLKELITRKGPAKVSPVQKSRQMLQTVRLNKRFELQMKHRMNQKNA